MKKFSSRTLAYAGVLIAMSVVLTRFIAIPIGQIFRITVGPVPIILCGCWFGPVVGGLSGAIADLIGCIINGYAPNPFITLSAALMGIIPVFFKKFVMKDSNMAVRFFKMLLVMAGTMMITSQGFTTFGLHMYYGLPFKATWISRLPQSAFLAVLDSFLVVTVYSRVHIAGLLNEPGRVRAAKQ